MKRRGLKLIISQYNLNNNKQIISVINQFRANNVLKETKKRICLKLLANKANNFNFSFKSWKNIPYQ